MQVTIEDVSSVKKILHVEVPNERVLTEIDKAYENLKKTAKLKGFRPGKTPRSVLERFFKKDVHSDVSNKLLQDSFIDVVREKELKIVGDPKIEPPVLDEKGPYKYDATIEIKPEIADIDFKGLTLKKNVYRISDEEIEAQLKMLQKNLAQQKTIEETRPAGEGDFALITYEGFKDGKPFEETAKTENFTIKLGQGRITKDFDSQIIGMNKGERNEIKVHFPEGYFNPKLENLDIVFDVNLNEIREEILPEINDELAKNLGGFNTLEELKDKIKENLSQGYGKRVEQELNEQIFTALIAKTQFEVPEAMIEFELENIIADAERSFAYHNTSLEALGLSKEILSVKYRDTAEKQIRRHLILDKIIEQEKLILKDDELEEGFNKMSESFNQPADEIKKYYRQNKDKLDYFKHTLLEKNAINLIIENSSVENTEPVPETETENPKE
ncbi:MAG: trigger factor [Thermodesulfobacteriota bacterium]|nr:trigger factor [Thermodesulfobacteriota bacterium]